MRKLLIRGTRDPGAVDSKLFAAQPLVSAIAIAQPEMTSPIFPCLFIRLPPSPSEAGHDGLAPLNPRPHDRSGDQGRGRLLRDNPSFQCGRHTVMGDLMQHIDPLTGDAYHSSGPDGHLLALAPLETPVMNE